MDTPKETGLSWVGEHIGGHVSRMFPVKQNSGEIPTFGQLTAQ